MPVKGKENTMSRKVLMLVGCERYNLNGETYERGRRYSLGESKANLLLSRKDDLGRVYFKDEEAVEAAAKEVEPESSPERSDVTAGDNEVVDLGPVKLDQPEDVEESLVEV